MKKISFVALLVSLFSSNLLAQSLNVVTSIKPLQLVAEAIVADLGKVDVLIPPGASPHHYALRPSDLRRLNDADLVVWVGPEMEQFLGKALKSTPAPVLQLMEGDAQAAGGHAHDHAEGEHHHGENDPHIWLDPVLMLEAADQIRQQLSLQAPKQAAQLQANYERFSAELIAAEAHVRQQLLPLQKRGFVVFHDAFSLLVDHYGLNQRAYFTVDPARAPGAKKLQQIQTLLEQENIGCVFTEPQFKAAVIERIVSGYPVRLGQLDPLAIDITTEQGYPGYLRALGANIQSCLQ
ncbi:zinc ABC transporter substrate-binding protein ZnuA [Neptuniibacter halophilus]|uniref:zinc ABC transporter substrate-binding protein ZnuA n=1 Tax=Neptuniibacter halophilus TaxID=651666 RepID=UPI00257265AB|nr:zinc ABC transporter substrate-binding protein ZnuA [Neptuniibacter halophilus]